MKDTLYVKLPNPELRRLVQIRALQLGRSVSEHVSKIIEADAKLAGLGNLEVEPKPNAKSDQKVIL